MTTASDARGGVLALGGVAFMVVAVAAAYLWRDRGEPETAVAASAPEKPLKVYFGGCHEVHEGPVCMLSGTATITLWMEDPGYEPVVLVDGRVQRVVRVLVDSGSQVTIAVTGKASTLSVRGSEETQTWTLELSESHVSAAVARGRKMRRADPRAALSLISESLSSADPKERAELLGLRARIERDLSLPSWKTTVREGTLAYDNAGCLSGAANILAFASFSHFTDGEFELANASLREMRKRAETAPELKIAYHYFRAIVLEGEGRPREALRELRELDHLASRVAETRYRVLAINIHLGLLTFFSRMDDIASLVDRLAQEADSTAPECQKAILLNNLSWFGRHIDIDASISRAEQAVKMHEESCVGYDEYDVKARLTLARLYLSVNDSERTTKVIETLSRFDEDSLSASSKHERDELLAELLLAGGELRSARDAFGRIRRETNLRKEPLRHWRATVGMAMATRHDSVEEAISLLFESERLLDEMARAVPLGEGRSMFVEDHRAATVELLELLIDVGRVSEAMNVAFNSARRYVSVVAFESRIEAIPPSSKGEWERHLRAFRSDKRNIARLRKGLWRRSRQTAASVNAEIERAESSLAIRMETMLSMLPPSSSEIATDEGRPVLLVHPSKTGLYIFMKRHEGMPFFVQTSGQNAESISRALVEAPKILDLVKTSLGVYVMAYGRLADLPLHAILMRAVDGPVPVSFSLGSPRSKKENTSSRALIVADPDGTLPNALLEANHVAARLKSAGWQVDMITGANVTRDGLLAALREPGYSLLHFAGHSSTMGVDGWRSSLKLADGQRFEISDVIALRHVPAIVVLSSCSGSGRGNAPVGMAQALLAKGAEIVVAATDQVDDATTSRMMQEIYAKVDMAIDARLAAATWTAVKSGNGISEKFRAYVR